MPAAAAKAASDPVAAAVPDTMAKPGAPAAPAKAGFRYVALAEMGKPVSKYPVGLIPLAADQKLRWPDQYNLPSKEPWKGERVDGVHWGPLTVNRDNQIVQRVAVAYSHNKDNSVFRLHFNPAAVFADGTPFTAAAAKASLEFGSMPENQAVWGGLIDRIDPVVGMIAVGKGDQGEAEGLVVIDKNTLELRLTAPTAHFPLNLTDSLMGFGNIESIEKDPDFRQHTPGIGPFKFTITPEDGYVRVTHSDHFWLDPPTLAGIDRPGIPDQQTRFIMYENEEIDIGPNFDVKSDPTHPLYNELIWQQSGGLGWFFAFHLDKPPFDDIKVRAALTHAVNILPIVDAVFPGGKAVMGIINGDMNCVDPEKLPYPGTGKNPWSGVYRYDPEYARQLLSESTYGSAANLPAINVWLRKSHQIQVGVLMQEQIRDNLGVEFNITRFEIGQTIPPDANVKRRSRGTGNADPAILMRDMAHSASGLIRDLGWHESEMGPVIDGLVDKALALPLDDPNRCAAFIEAERLATADYRYIPNSATVPGFGLLHAPWILGLETGWRGRMIGLEYYQIGERDRSLYRDHEWGRGPSAR
jgi:ABC-type transport system substrate-binding protein